MRIVHYIRNSLLCILLVYALVLILAPETAHSIGEAGQILLKRMDGSTVGTCTSIKVADGMIQPTTDGQGNCFLGAGATVDLDTNGGGCADGTDNVLCAITDKRSGSLYLPTTGTAPSGACTVGDHKVLTASARGAAV